MFDRDFWTEVLQTIKGQKLRSLMTAFGVFWGLLMLMFLIGAGMGFHEGMVGQLQNIPSNTVFYISGTTSLPYEGFQQGRSWNIENADIEAVRSEYPDAIQKTAGIKYLPMEGSLLSVSSDEATDELVVAGVSPNLFLLSPQRMIHGRYINEFDCADQRKVCVLGENVAKTLFPDMESPVGENVNIDGTTFQVIGVTRKTNDMVNFGPNESNSVFLPITTAQFVFNLVDKIDRLFLVLDEKYPSAEFYTKADAIIRQRHHIHPDDDVAMVSLDVKSQLNQFDIMISGLNSLIWLVGLGTLLAGLVGISNIMMVTVKERTQEIGIRRALGAEPWTIIKQIMCESLVLTLAAGIAGIVVGVWGMNLINRVTASAMTEGGFFNNPYVPFVPAVAALAVLVLGGLMAGFVPAKRAMAIKAIEALREE
jgi:putative ABC transport system permease protein